MNFWDGTRSRTEENKHTKNEVTMAVFKNADISFDEVHMDGVNNVRKANVIGPGQGWRGHTLRVFCLRPEGFTPHHQHDWEHVNYVMKGQGTLTIGDETHELTEGDFAFVPPSIDHQFRNPYDEEFEFICIVPERGAY